MHKSHTVFECCCNLGHLSNISLSYMFFSVRSAAHVRAWTLQWKERGVASGNIVELCFATLINTSSVLLLLLMQKRHFGLTNSNHNKQQDYSYILTLPAVTHILMRSRYPCWELISVLREELEAAANKPQPHLKKKTGFCGLLSKEKLYKLCETLSATNS